MIRVHRHRPWDKATCSNCSQHISGCSGQSCMVHRYRTPKCAPSPALAPVAIIVCVDGAEQSRVFAGGRQTRELAKMCAYRNKKGSRIGNALVIAAGETFHVSITCGDLTLCSKVNEGASPASSSSTTTSVFSSTCTSWHRACIRSRGIDDRLYPRISPIQLTESSTINVLLASSRDKNFCQPLQLLQRRAGQL